MSNLDFDIKCIQPDILGICEPSNMGLPGLSDCALPEICIGGANDLFTTVESALALGLPRIRIRGDVTETGSFALPAYTHIWIDGGVTWTIPTDVTLDTSASVEVMVEGNTSGTLVFSRTSAGSLFTAPASTNVTYQFQNLLIDYSATTSGDVQIVPRDALQRFYNITITLPNVADLRLFDFTLDTVDPQTEVSNSLENIVFIGTGTSITHVIGNSLGTAIGNGNLSNITFTGTFPTGDGTFALPLIEVIGAIGGGAFNLEGLHSDITSGVHDVILSGKVSNIARRNLGGSPTFNVRFQGFSGMILENSTISIFEALTTSGKYSNITAGTLTLGAGGINFFSGCQFGVFATPSVTIPSSNNTFAGCSIVSASGSSFTISGDFNAFSGCTLGQPGPGPAPVGAIVVSGTKNVFSGCNFADSDSLVIAESFLYITGTDNVFTGCSRSSTAILSTRNVEIDGTAGGLGARTIIAGCNWVAVPGTAIGLSTIVLTGAPVDVNVTNNIVDNPVVGAGGGGSIVGSNIVA